MKFLLRIIITTLAVLVTSYLLPKTWVHVESFKIALIVALVLSFLNAFVRPLLIILTIPATIFTLGLFLLAINAFIILIADHFVNGFEIPEPHRFWKALMFSFVLAIVNGILDGFRKADENRNNPNDGPNDSGQYTDYEEVK